MGRRPALTETSYICGVGKPNNRYNQKRRKNKPFHGQPPSFNYQITGKQLNEI
jgi:hypothetical protein